MSVWRSGTPDWAEDSRSITRSGRSSVSGDRASIRASSAERVGGRREYGIGPFAPVAADGVGIVHPADLAPDRRRLVAVIQIDRHDHPPQIRRRRTRRQIAQAEPRQGDTSHRQGVGVFGDHVRAIVPHGAIGLQTAQRPGVGVVDEAIAPGLGVRRQGGAARLRVLARRIAIQPVHHEPIPHADAGRIGPAEVQSVAVRDHPGRGIVHHRGPVRKGRGGEVVGDAQGVTDLVRRQLAQALIGQLVGVVFSPPFRCGRRRPDPSKIILS